MAIMWVMVWVLGLRDSDLGCAVDFLQSLDEALDIWGDPGLRRTPMHPAT